MNNLNQFSISWKVDSHTESKPYSWSNDKAFARITFSSTITAGTLEFAMLDNAATSVCAITFGTASTASGDAVTKAPGQPGRWTIRFNLRGMSGTVAASIVAVDSASGGSTTAGGPSCT